MSRISLERKRAVKGTGGRKGERRRGGGTSEKKKGRCERGTRNVQASSIMATNVE